MRAGRMVREWAGRPAEITTKSGPADLVTEMDRRAEVLIREELSRRFPDHDLFGEEAGGRRDAEHVWYIDPIDGTTNFVHGLPGYTVSIALAWRGQPVAAAVYDPTAQELFVACRGRGTTANGRRVQVSGERTLAEALVGTGIPPVEPSQTYALASMMVVGRRARNIRNLGSAAIHLAYVASGRLSGFWEPALQPWDVAAGVLLLREAGGRATDIPGQDWHTGLRGMLGSNGLIHAELQAALAGVAGPEI